MKILIVCENLHYPYTEMAGIKGIYDINKKLAREGFKLTILTGINSISRRAKDWAKKQNNVDFEFVVGKNLLIRKMKMLGKIISLIKKEKFDAVHIYTSMPFILNFNFILRLFFKKIKIFSSIVTNYGPLSSNRFLFFKSFDKLILNDFKNFDYFKNKKNLNPVLLPISVSKKEVKPSYASKIKFLSFIGPLREDKGVLLFIDMALSLLKRGKTDLIFNIVTYGKSVVDPDYSLRKKVILKKIKGFEKHFKIYEGFVDIEKFLRKTDVLIYPLKRLKGTLTTPLTLIEAMASGKIIISSNFKGHEHLIKDSFNGFVFDVNKEHSLFKAVLKILKKKGLKKFGLNARKTFLKNYCLEDNIKKLIKLYRS